MTTKYPSAIFNLNESEKLSLSAGKYALKKFFDECIPGDFILFKNPEHITLDSRSVMFAIEVIDAIMSGKEFSMVEIIPEQFNSLMDINKY